MALRAASAPVAATISWVGAAVYAVFAQVVAITSTIEIGPNLLAFGTSIIGAVVLLGQVYLAQRVKKVDHVEERVETAEAKADTAKAKAARNEERINSLENGTK